MFVSGVWAINSKGLRCETASVAWAGCSTFYRQPMGSSSCFYLFPEEPVAVQDTYLEYIAMSSLQISEKAEAGEVLSAVMMALCVVDYWSIS